MNNPAPNTMPMAAAAQSASSGPPVFPPASGVPPMGAAPVGPPAMPSAAPSQAPSSLQMPPTNAPAQPPGASIEPQPDGSAAWVINSPVGKVFLARIEPPKIPKAFNAPAQQPMAQ